MITNNPQAQPIYPLSRFQNRTICINIVLSRSKYLNKIKGILNQEFNGWILEINEHQTSECVHVCCDKMCKKKKLINKNLFEGNVKDR